MGNHRGGSASRGARRSPPAARRADNTGTAMSSRLWGIIAKEFIQLWRDRLALTLALFVPVAMLFIFGWAINTDVKHVPTAVFDQSGGVEARTLLEAFTNSQYFDIVQQAVLRHRPAGSQPPRADAADRRGSGQGRDRDPARLRPPAHPPERQRPGHRRRLRSPGRDLWIGGVDD